MIRFVRDLSGRRVRALPERVSKGATLCVGWSGAQHGGAGDRRQEKHAVPLAIYDSDVENQVLRAEGNNAKRFVAFGFREDIFERISEKRKEIVVTR